jgi:hypothetical protein
VQSYDCTAEGVRDEGEMRDYGFLVAFGAGFVDFIEPAVLAVLLDLAAGLVAFIAPALAGALVAFTAGSIAAVFWSSGFLVAFGAGFVDFIDDDFIDDDFIDFIDDLAAGFVLLVAVFGAGLALGAAAIAGAVIRNAVARSDARIFFMCVHLLP